MDTRSSLDTLTAARSYEVLGEIATGGMATVYLGRLRRSLGFARLVAIKCMHPQFARDPSFVSMFVDEARITARLRHPNVVPTLDIVDRDGQLLIVMEYVEGDTLASILRTVASADAMVPPRVACAIAHDTLLGLHEAHEALDDDGASLGVIHRDVSPQNVMVGLDGMARVLDFGVAKAKSRVHHSECGEIKGKIPYMPPEQLFGEEIDRRVDVYAAGIVLWETLTRRRLFDGPSEEVLVRRITQEPIAAPSKHAANVPEALDAVVLKALSREPADRFATALEMAEALAEAITLPNRSEIAAWVRKLVPARPATPLDVAPKAMAIQAQAVEAALEAATRAEPRRAPKRRPSRALVLGASAMLIGLVATSLTAYAKGTPASHRLGHIERRAAGENTVHAVPTRVVEEQTAITIVAAAPTTEPRASAPKAVRNAAARAIEERHDACRVPYVYDAEGHRHFKVECL